MLLVASCSAAPDLPDPALVTPVAGCKVVAVLPAEPLSDGNGGAGDPRARVQYDADCVPDVAQPSGTLLAYRLRFEQDFTHARVYPGGQRVWRAGEPRYADDSDQPRRQLDAATAAQGKNCTVLLEQLDARVLPCLKSRDPQVGRRLRQSLDAFRARSRFTVNVNGDNGLNALRLGRDTACLAHWQQLQAQLGGSAAGCAVR